MSDDIGRVAAGNSQASSPPGPAVHKERRQRRPTGAPPPLPHPFAVSTAAWLVLGAVVIAGAFLASQHTPWLRLDDRFSTWVLRWLAGMRTPWLTDVANGINGAGSGWGATVLGWSVAELILGANPAVWMYASGPVFAQLLWRLGTPEQKRFAERAIERGWTPTMVLTEPDAGSDVGAGRTKAVEQPDGTWHIEGVKRFITCAEHDMAENIFHLVLARPEGHGPGTKGLSMFLVPKYLVGADGTLGERNGVEVTNRRAQDGPEGLRPPVSSPSAARRPAVGTLVGGRPRRHPADVHDHRARPDDGRDQGDRHPVDRLPERAGLRQARGCRAPT